MQRDISTPYLFPSGCNSVILSEQPLLAILSQTGAKVLEAALRQVIKSDFKVQAREFGHKLRGSITINYEGEKLDGDQLQQVGMRKQKILKRKCNRGMA